MHFCLNPRTSRWLEKLSTQRVWIKEQVCNCWYALATHFIVKKNLTTPWLNLKYTCLLFIMFLFAIFSCDNLLLEDMLSFSCNAIFYAIYPELCYLLCHIPRSSAFFLNVMLQYITLTPSYAMFSGQSRGCILGYCCTARSAQIKTNHQTFDT
jgi:hypothetical protein